MSDPWNTVRRATVSAGLIVRTRREAAGWTLQDVADMTGSTKSYLSEIETGKRVPDEATAAALMMVVRPFKHAQAGATGLSGVDTAPTTWARVSDPLSSHATVASIDADVGLAQAIMRQAFGTFDDTDLEQRLGHRWQRNVIARARGRLERDGAFVRVGPVSRRDRERPTIHFTKEQT